MYGIHFSRPRTRSPCATATICLGHLVRKDTLPHETPNPPRARIFAFVLCFLALACFTPQARAQQGTLEGTTNIPVEGGTLSYQTYFYSANCGPGAYFNQTTYTNFTFAIGGATFPLGAQQVVAQGFGSVSCPNYTQPSSVPIPLPNTNNSPVQAGECVYTFSNGGGSAYCPTLSTSTLGPAYQVVSILYAPPGNKSTEGLVSGVTDGTITTVGSNFTYAQTMSSTNSVPGVLTFGGFYGSSTTSSDSLEFVSTWQNAVGAINDTSTSPTLNSGNYDSIDHTRDDIAIWLNPLVTVVTDEDTNEQISYQMSSAPTSGTSTPYADVLLVPAGDMMPNSSGATTVPNSVLIPQQISGTSGLTVPGLASICKNLNKTEYVAKNCGTDQCGCTPADFAQIVAQDALLNYNTTNFTSNPVPGSTSPASVDVSGTTCTATNPVHTYPSYAIPDCRYVIIPASQGSTSSELLQLSGSSGSSLQNKVQDSTILTTGSSNSYTTGITIGASTPIYGQKVTDQWTWQNFERTGQSNGGFNQMNVLLETTTAACQEEVALYEDTLYHTIVFQTPQDPSVTGCSQKP